MTEDQKPGNFKLLFEQAISETDALQRQLAAAARLTGFTRDRLKSMQDYWNELESMLNTNPEVEPVLASGVAYLTSYNEQLFRLADLTSIPNHNFQSLAGTIDTFSAVTSALALTINTPNIKQVHHEPNPFRQTTEDPTLAERLSKLDPQLGKVYQQIWESLYGTNAEPERTALYQMRQVFDHLFEILAPDEQVRKSVHFKKKKGIKPDQVDRKERLQFAAFSRIKDNSEAQTMAASSVQLLEVYQALNQAHKRGELNSEKARTALVAMQSFLQNWADALEL